MKRRILNLMTLIVVLGLALWSTAGASAQDPTGDAGNPVEVVPSPAIAETPPSPAPLWSSGRSGNGAPWQKPFAAAPEDLDPLAVGGPDSYGYRYADNVEHDELQHDLQQHRHHGDEPEPERRRSS